MRHRRASAPPSAPAAPEPKKEERIGAVVVSWDPASGNPYRARPSGKHGVIRLDLDGREVSALWSGGAQLKRELRPSRAGQRVIAWRDSKTRWRAQLAEAERVEPVPGSATTKARPTPKPVPGLLVPVLRAELAGGASTRAVAEKWNLTVEQVSAARGE